MDDTVAGLDVGLDDVGIVDLYILSIDMGSDSQLVIEGGDLFTISDLVRGDGTRDNVVSEDIVEGLDIVRVQNPIEDIVTEGKEGLVNGSKDSEGAVDGSNLKEG